MNFLKNAPLLVILLFLTGFMFLIPWLYALASGDAQTAIAFIFSFVLVFLGAGFLTLTIATRSQNHTINRHTSEIVFVFLLLPIVMALPLYQISSDVQFFDVYFEMVNALTTTGATIYTGQDLPDAGHLWRGIVGWCGGALIWVLAANFFTTNEIIPVQNERITLSKTTTISKLAHIATRFIPLYLSITVLLWFGLIATGIKSFEAFMIALATVSTSGILAGDSSLSTAITPQIVILIVLLFAFSRRSMMGETLWFRRNSELRIAFFIIACIAGLLSVTQIFQDFGTEAAISLKQALKYIWQNIFLATSFLSTTGFLPEGGLIAEQSGKHSIPLIVAMALCALGGGIATTAGGLKLFRFYSLLDHNKREIQRLVHPSGLGGASLLPREKRIKIAAQAWGGLIFISVLFVFGALALGWSGYDFETALVLVLSALSNTGPLINLLPGENLNLINAPDTAKSFLIVIMILGRVEILGAVAFISFICKK